MYITRVIAVRINFKVLNLIQIDSLKKNKLIFTIYQTNCLKQPLDMNLKSIKQSNEKSQQSFSSINHGIALRCSFNSAGNKD